MTVQCENDFSFKTKNVKRKRKDGGFHDGLQGMCQSDL